MPLGAYGRLCAEMIKKALFLLLVLVLVAPLAGLACDCCPGNSSETQIPEIKAPDCDCCVSVELKHEASNLTRLEKPLSAPARILLISPFKAAGIYEAEFQPASPSGDLTSPFLFSPTPLYLTIQILRI